MKHKIAKPFELCYQLIPVEWLAQLAFVCGKGAIKRAAYDWEENAATMSYSDRLDSAMRHIEKFRMGQSHDKETGAHNLGAAAWNCLCVYSLFVRETGIDDRRGNKLPTEECVRIEQEVTSISRQLLFNTSDPLEDAKPTKIMFHRDMIIGPMGPKEYVECKQRLFDNGELLFSPVTPCDVYQYLYYHNRGWVGRKIEESPTVPYDTVGFPDDKD